MDLCEVVQRIVQDNIEAQKPTDISTGTVVSTSPLNITIDVELPPLSGDDLILTEAVKAWDETVTIEYSGGTPQSAVIHHKGLTIGDKVIMIRVSKGQRFIVLSRA